MSTQIVNISLPQDLVQKIDQAAKGSYASRSEYIRQAVVSRLRTQDTGAWDELIVGADELSALAEKAGLVTDEDFVRAVKELRQAKRKG